MFHFQISAMETPGRSEPIAQEDKTKLLKSAFLLFCRYVSMKPPFHEPNIDCNIDCECENVKCEGIKNIQLKAC